MLVLVSTLLAAAGVGMLMLGPLVFETPPPALERRRPLVLVLAALAAGLLGVEWLVVH